MADGFAEIKKREVDPMIQGIDIIDVDTHYSEPHDLWTSRAPAKLKDRVPRVITRPDGKLDWVLDGEISLATNAMAVSVVRPDGSVALGRDFMNMTIKDIHPSSYDIKERLKMMDASNIKAQIIYPNVLGFGGQHCAKVDGDLRLASVQIYNDFMADMQEESGGRLCPMIMTPWWDVKDTVKEIERMLKRGMKGVNCNTDPQSYPGVPDLGDPHWDPMWALCQEAKLPINFHIGASNVAIDWITNLAWKSNPNIGRRFGVSSVFLFFGNARVMANLLLSGICERFPGIQFVSVESGVGWIPFLLEALDYQVIDGQPDHGLSMKPSELFARNFHGCFWFEKKNLAESVRAVGVDRVMFETDFPHPTCSYPEGPDYVMKGLAGLTYEERKMILETNARKLYNITI